MEFGHFSLTRHRLLTDVYSRAISTSSDGCAVTEDGGFTAMIDIVYTDLDLILYFKEKQNQLSSRP